MRRTVQVFAVLAAVSAGALAAQETPETAQEALPAVGTRVRLHTPGMTEPLTGTFASISGSHMAVIRAPGDTAQVPLGSISKFGVSRGSRSNALPGAKVGAIIGGSIGAMFGILLMAEDDGFFEFGAEAIPAGMAGGAIMGGTIGLLFGALSRSERWTDTEPPTVSVVVMRGGAGARIRF